MNVEELMTRPFVCHRGLHRWDSKEEAERCCQGWIPMYVPFQYGSEWIPYEEWFRPHKKGWFKMHLVPKDEMVSQLIELLPPHLLEELDLGLEPNCH